MRPHTAMLRAWGTVGIVTWGRDVAVPAQQVWTEELDRHGAPSGGPLITRNEVMNTLGKLTALLDAAGFCQCRAEIVLWSHQPSMDEFITQRSTLDVAGRRLSRLTPQRRAAFLQRIRARLESLSPEDFIDRSEVITAVAIAR